MQAEKKTAIAAIDGGEARELGNGSNASSLALDAPAVNDGVRWTPPADWRIPAIPELQAIVSRVERSPIARCECCRAELAADDGKVCRDCEERTLRRLRRARSARRSAERKVRSA